MDVYVVHPVESADRNKCLWLLLTASYELVNANAKWKVMSDLFYYRARNSSITAALAKSFDDFLICGEHATVDDSVSSLNDRYTLGTIVHGPYSLRYFGLSHNLMISLFQSMVMTSLTASPPLPLLVYSVARLQTYSFLLNASSWHPLLAPLAGWVLLLLHFLPFFRVCFN